MPRLCPTSILEPLVDDRVGDVLYYLIALRGNSPTFALESGVDSVSAALEQRNDAPPRPRPDPGARDQDERLQARLIPLQCVIPAPDIHTFGEALVHVVEEGSGLLWLFLRQAFFSSPRAETMFFMNFSLRRLLKK